MFGPNRSYRLPFPIIRPLWWKKIYIHVYISSCFQFPFTEHWKSSWKIRTSNVLFFSFFRSSNGYCLFVCFACLIFFFFHPFSPFSFYIYIFFFFGSKCTNADRYEKYYLLFRDITTEIWELDISRLIFFITSTNSGIKVGIERACFSNICVRLCMFTYI